MARVVSWLIPLLLAAAPVQGLARNTIVLDSDWRSSKPTHRAPKSPRSRTPSGALERAHDWSIEGPFDQKNPAGGAGGWLPRHRLVSEHFTFPRLRQSARLRRV